MALFTGTRDRKIDGKDRLVIPAPIANVIQAESAGRLFLVPRQIEKHGLKRFQIEFTSDALMFLIERYTREAGVRNLEREIASVCRKLARRVLKDKIAKGSTIEVSTDTIGELLGKPRYRAQRPEQEPEVGAALGLAWTQVGGELLQTETTLMRGKGQLTLT